MRTGLQGPSSGALVREVGRLFGDGTVSGLSEGELLDRFVRARDEAAFEAIVTRHGPMVLGVCRRLLRDPNDVDDAFQATFLVLVRKAGTLRSRELLGNWLYGVAYRVANRARVVATRRAARTPLGSEAVQESAAIPRPEPEPLPWLHEEVRRLPEKYRILVLLCYFEGLSHEEAAHRLGCPIGTVKGRLARAREMLRKRLVRRGVAMPGGELSLVVGRVAVPEPLQAVTLRTARAFLGLGGSYVVPLPVANLVDGVLRIMMLTHAKSAGLAVLTALGITTGLVLAEGQSAGRPGGVPIPPEPSKAEAQSQPPGPQQKALREPAGAGLMSGIMRKERRSGSVEATSLPENPRGGFGGASEIEERASEYFTSEKTINGMSREARLRLTIAELGTAVTEWGKNPANDRAWKCLDQPLTLSFPKPTPLSEVLKFVRSKMTGPNGALPIYVDPQALQEAGNTIDSEVAIDLEGVPLRTSLRLMLKQLGLAYCVRDGVLIISSVEGVREELGEAVRELMGSSQHRDEIDHTILMRSGLFPRMRTGMGAAGNMGGGGMGMM